MKTNEDVIKTEGIEYNQTSEFVTEGNQDYSMNSYTDMMDDQLSKNNMNKDTSHQQEIQIINPKFNKLQIN